MSAQRLSGALRRGLRLNIRAAVAGKVSGSALLNGAIAKRFGLSRGRVAVIGSGSATLPAPGAVTLVVKFTTKAKRKLTRAKRVPLTLAVTVSPAAGPKATGSKPFNLRR